MYYNSRFINRFSPTKSSLYGIGIWIVVFIASSLVPNKENISFSIEAILFLTFSIILFLFGIQVGRVKLLKKASSLQLKHYSLSYGQKVNLLYLIFFISITSLLILLIDKFAIRGISLSQSVFENRNELESSSGLISIFAAIFSPLCFIPLFMFYQLNIEKKRILKLASYMIFFFPALIYLLVGSRSGIIVIILLLGLILFYFKKIKFSLKRTMGLCIVGLLFSMLMTHIFVERTKEFTSKPYQHIIYNSGVNFTLKASPSLEKSILNTNSPIKKYFYLTYLNFTQYYLHGVYEFIYLYDNFKNEHARGKYTFYVYYKFLSKITGNSSSKEEISSLQPRNGIYTTFFGPLFTDFGWFTLLFSFIFGVIQTKVYFKVKKNKFYWLPIYFYFIIINLFIPVFNFISGAQGLYLITSFLIFTFFCKTLCADIIVYKDEHTVRKLKLL